MRHIFPVTVPAVAQVNNNPSLLASILSYHVLPGKFVDNGALIAATAPATTVGRTLLTNLSLVHLEGNKGQVLAWTRSDSVFFLDQRYAYTIPPPDLEQ